MTPIGPPGKASLAPVRQPAEPNDGAMLGAAVQRIATDLMIASERHEQAVLTRTCRQIGDACGARAVVIDQIDLAGETDRVTSWHASGQSSTTGNRFDAEFPLVSPSLVAGFLRVETNGRPPGPEVQTALYAAAALIANFRSRVAAEHRLRRQMEFTNLLRDTSQRFAAMRSKDGENVIPRALQSLGEYLGASLVAIWTFDNVRSLGECRFRWTDGRPEHLDAPTEVDLTHIRIRDLNMPDEVIDLAAVGPVSERLGFIIGAVGGDPLVRRDELRRLAVPMSINRQRAGTMTLAVPHGRELEDWEAAGLLSFASLVPELLQRFEAEDMLSASFRVSPMPITLRNVDGELLDCNQAMCDFLGRPRSELLGSVPEDVFGLTEVDADPKGGWSPPPCVGPHDLDMPFEHRDGHIVWGRVTATLLRSAATSVVLSHIEDVTQARAERERLRAQAMIDELTGLPNRHGLAEMVSGQGGQEAGRALLMIDLNNFKVINDDFGHPVGDALLRVVGERLAKSVRGTDRASRYGGDEFLVLLDGPISEVSAFQVAENIHAAFTDPIVVTGHSHQISLSIGVTLVHEALAEGFPAALSRADVAMYRAKADGPGVTAFEPAPVAAPAN